MTLSTLLILAVRRTHVIHEPRTWLGSPRVSRNSVVRASDQCAEGSIPVGDSDFFFVPRW